MHVFPYKLCEPEEEAFPCAKVLPPHPLVVLLVPLPPAGGAVGTKHLQTGLSIHVRVKLGCQFMEDLNWTGNS